MLGQVVRENIREEAQEIKRLLSIKNIDVDETVVCELMESLDPNHEVNRTKYIIDMILGNRNFNSQASSIKAEQSAEMLSQDNTKEFSKHDVHNTSTESATIDVSDSEDDTDYYYSSNYDDNSIIETSTTTTSSSGTVFDTAMETSNTSNTSNNSPITKSCVKVDQSEIEFLEAEIEFLEENNNNNDVIYMKSVTYEKNRFSESPKPGCSKDSDDRSQSFEDYCHSCDFNELQIDAKQIHNVLPNIDYDLICKTLCNNQLAKNRIELTLWDLLQKERPSPQLATNKRKYMPYEIYCMKNKRNSDILPEKNTKDTKIVLEKKKQACAENKTKTIDVELTNREPMLLVNETDKMEIDITEGITTINDNVNNTDDTNNAHDDRNNEANNTNNDANHINNAVNNMYDDANNTNNETKNEQMAATPETNTVCLNTNWSPNDVNMDKDNSEKLDPPRRVKKSKNNHSAFIQLLHDKMVTERKNRTKNWGINYEAMQNHEAVDYRLPHKIEMDNMHSAMSTSMPSTSASCTQQKVPLLRPARFTGGSVPVVFPSFYSPVPILSPPKLRILDPLQMIVDMQTDLKHPNKSVKAKAEENRGKLYEPPVPMGHVPSSAQLSKFAMNNTSLHTQDEIATFDKILNCHLKKDRSNEESSNSKRQNNMNAHGVYHTKGQKEKEDFMSSIGMETNKEKQSNPTNNTGEIILNEKARNLYYRLIPMFPSVNTVYIKRICQRYVTDPKYLSYKESVSLQHLVEHLLEHGQKYPIKKPDPLPLENNSNTYTLNEQYADLLGIFPEADPTYLRKVAEENYKDPEKIKEYVQSQLESPSYPTRAQALARKKITDQQKQYTSDFKIEQFLELFPDPFSHFENSSRQCKFNPHAVDFLKQYFSKIRVNTLLYTYTEHQHNLSLTAKALEALSPDMKSKRAHNKIMLTEDIPLLQECAFIQHKVALKKYLTELKDQEEKEFQELKAKNELIECQCCYDNECMPSNCSTCEDGHVFCNACIIKSTELTLANGKTHVDCLLNCGNEFSLSILQKILPPTKFSILLCKRQEAEVMAAGLEGLVSCPFCHFASIPPLEDKVFRCLNPNCMKESCRLCKELNHIPLKCDELKSDVARLYLEEKMTEALVRKCYKCGRTFFKEEGCNKMTCLCGAQMCYICDKPVIDYKHFQGQGVQDSNLCPLWSDDRRMNAESVIKVCHETLKHIKQKNPQVDINFAALLPKLPPKAKGPHEDIAFANAVPAHAERVARHNP